jgi:hypothetical protein
MELQAQKLAICIFCDKILIPMIFGGVAQPDRARGSYPLGRWFKSTLRHLILQRVNDSHLSSRVVAEPAEKQTKAQVSHNTVVRGAKNTLSATLIFHRNHLCSPTYRYCFVKSNHGFVFKFYAITSNEN